MVSENVLPEPELETTGTVAPASEGGAVVPAPKLEVYEEPAARSED